MNSWVSNASRCHGELPPSAAGGLPLPPPPSQHQGPGTWAASSWEGRNGKVKLGIRKVLCCTVVFLPFKVVLDFRIENVFC